MASYYHLPDSIVNGTATPVSGRYLAHNHLSDVAHAFMAAELTLGVTFLTDPTLTQSARLARVNPTYAWWAKARFAEREAIEFGIYPARAAAPHRPGQRQAAAGVRRGVVGRTGLGRAIRAQRRVRRPDRASAHLSDRQATTTTAYAGPIPAALTSVGVQRVTATKQQLRTGTVRRPVAKSLRRDPR